MARNGRTSRTKQVNHRLAASHVTSDGPMVDPTPNTVDRISRPGKVLVHKEERSWDQQVASRPVTSSLSQVSLQVSQLLRQLVDLEFAWLVKSVALVSWVSTDVTYISRWLAS